MENTACFLLALVVTLVPVSTTLGDNNKPKNISAVVGRSVTFRCPWNLSIPVYRLYIQKLGNQPLFINGFNNGKKLPVSPEYQDRTEVNQAELSMEMTNIKLSDEGSYKCVVFSSTSSRDIFQINLKVTAEFTTPELKSECSENDGAKKGRSCQMSCSAAGGYPVSDVKWLGLNQSRIRVLQNETAENSTSKTWSVNQTINYTCEHPINVSCDIGGSDSHTITICEAESFPLKVIVAIVFVLVFVMLLVLAFFMMLFCRRQRPQPYRADHQVDGAHIPLDDCHSQRQSV
ncbi:cluster of Differentiation 80/86 isoform X1 [Danio rerio]|uniref:Cluster of Differentiation 80/86 isoform X1 n=2 Tax=Danio rerio TaxID=7955 RepID=A0AC58H9V7_DANRE